MEGQLSFLEELVATYGLEPTIGAIAAGCFILGLIAGVIAVKISRGTSETASEGEVSAASGMESKQLPDPNIEIAAAIALAGHAFKAASGHVFPKVTPAITYEAVAAIALAHHSAGVRK